MAEASIVQVFTIQLLFPPRFVASLVALQHIRVQFSAAVPGDLETCIEMLLADPEGTNKKLKQLWFACGKDDSLLARSEQVDKVLQEHNIRYVYRETEGAHTWTVWRKYLAEFAPLLFK